MKTQVIITPTTKTLQKRRFISQFFSRNSDYCSRVRNSIGLTIITLEIKLFRLKPNSITLSGSNHLRTSSEPTSLMEFGFKPLKWLKASGNKLGLRKITYIISRGVSKWV